MLLVVPFCAVAQEEVEAGDVMLKNEISLGLGAAYPTEKDPLNVPGEPAIPTSFGLNIGYRHFFNEHLALGMRMYGYVSKLKDYYVVKENSTEPTRADFDFSAANISVEGLMLFGQRPVQPYVFVLFGYSTGSLRHDEFGSLTINGVSGGGGAGLRVAVSNSVSIFIEGIGSLGTGAWKQKPFTNSLSDKFNPTVMMALAGIDIAWQ